MNLLRYICIFCVVAIMICLGLEARCCCCCCPKIPIVGPTGPTGPLATQASDFIYAYYQGSTPFVGFVGSNGYLDVIFDTVTASSGITASNTTPTTFSVSKTANYLVGWTFTMYNDNDLGFNTQIAFYDNLNNQIPSAFAFSYTPGRGENPAERLVSDYFFIPLNAGDTIELILYAFTWPADINAAGITNPSIFILEIPEYP